MPEYSLMSHQRDGLKFLKKKKGVAALLYDPGVGKTGTTLAYVDHLAAKYGEVRVLVVAPLTATDTWVLQAAPFMDAAVKARVLSAPVKKMLTTIEQSRDFATVPKGKIMVDHPGDPSHPGKATILSMSAGAVSSWCADRTRAAQMVRAVRRYDPHLIVVDESHIIKSASANVSKAVYQMGLGVPHRIILTGTVTPHSPLDVYGQWRFLAPWTFSDSYGDPVTKKPHKMTKADWATIRPWPFGRFKARYAVTGGYQNHEVVGYNNLDDLNKRVAKRAHVVSKKDALPDLPPVRDVDVHITLSPAEQRAYDEMRRDLAAQLEDGSLLEAPNALAKLMKLRQMTAGFVRDTETGVDHEIGVTKRKAVCEVVNTTLAGEDRVVVFAYFRPECAALAKALSTKGQTVEVITGDTKAKDRLAIRQRFGDVSGNPGRMILVAQARTMSVSVNELITAQNAVFATLSERRDDWVQARGRLDRNGQVGQHVTFWNVYAPGTVDEITLDRHKDRGDLEKALLDHIRNTTR